MLVRWRGWLLAKRMQPTNTGHTRGGLVASRKAEEASLELFFFFFVERMAIPPHWGGVMRRLKPGELGCLLASTATVYVYVVVN